MPTNSIILLLFLSLSRSVYASIRAESIGVLVPIEMEWVQEMENSVAAVAVVVVIVAATVAVVGTAITLATLLCRFKMSLFVRKMLWFQCFIVVL